MGVESREVPIDQRIVELARRQHGIVSRAQLAEIGIGRGAIDERRRKGWLQLVHRGVYVVGHPNLTRNGHFMAAVLAGGEGAALSHFSAAVLWGMLTVDGKIHVTAPADRGRPGLVVHRARLDAGELVRRAGIAVTTPARTLIDLADVAPVRTLERAMDEAEFLRLDCTGLAPKRGRRGSGALSSVLAVHRPGSTRTRSHLEELFIALCDQHDLPRPEVNSCIEGYECDFVWREQRLIVETDGAAAHGSWRQRRRDLERDAELVAAGWRVIRLTYERLASEPGRVAEQIGRALRPARPPATRAVPRRPSRRREARPRRPRP
jgi:very-short-patch-repair endonuclease